MSIDFGAVPANSVLPIFWTSHDGATGANETMSGLALADIIIYKGVSLTQRSSTAGFAFFGGDADGLDLDTFVGVNGVSIDLADNTDAGFYAVGSFYTVVLGPMTIDLQTVYTVLATFRIVAAELIVGQPIADVGGWLGTAPATPTVNGVPEVDLTHVAGSTTSVSTIATTLATLLADIGGIATAAADGDPTATDLLFAYIKQLINILIGTAGIVTWPASAAPGNAVSLAEAVRAIWDDTNALPDSGALTTVQADLDNIQTRLPAALVGGRMDADVGALGGVVQSLTDFKDFADDGYDPVTNKVQGVVLADTLTTYTGNTPQTGDSFARLGLPAGASVSADIAAIEAQTDDIGAAGAGLTAVPWNAAWDAEAESEVTDALNAILTDSIPADGTLPTLRQALYMLVQFMLERSVSGTTVTVKKADGATALFTLTLDDATSPLSITRAT